MYCVKCGKELEEGWVKCPYCEETITGKNVNVDSSPESLLNESEAPVNGENKMIKKKSGKLKKISIGIGIVVLVFIGIALAMPSNDSGEKKEVDNNEAPTIRTMEEVGGYEQWKEDGYPGSVRAGIIVDLPITYREVNNYVVRVDDFAIHPIIIMQENEASVLEWDWLQNAQSLSDDENYAYFEATLTYLGQKERDEYPVFLIADIESYDEIWGIEDEVVNETSDYIFPESNTRYLTEEEVRNVSTENLRLGRNEIFARHGRIFDSEDLNTYFSTIPWYSGTINANDFNEDSILNDYEKKNAQLIKQIEDEGSTSSSTDSFIGTTGQYISGTDEESPFINITDINDGTVYFEIGNNQNPVLRGNIEATIGSATTAEGVCGGAVFTIEWKDSDTISVWTTSGSTYDDAVDSALNFMEYYNVGENMNVS